MPKGARCFIKIHWQSFKLQYGSILIYNVLKSALEKRLSPNEIIIGECFQESVTVYGLEEIFIGC